MAISTQSPVPAQDGSFLHQSSVSGEKINVSFSGGTVGDGNNITLTAGQYGSFTSTLSVVDQGGNLSLFSEVLPFAFTSYYVDGYTSDYLFLEGVSSGSIKISISPYLRIVNSTEGFTHKYIAGVYNGGSSSHVIYGDLEWKVLITTPVTA